MAAVAGFAPRRRLAAFVAFRRPGRAKLGQWPAGAALRPQVAPLSASPSTSLSASPSTSPYTSPYPAPYRGEGTVARRRAPASPCHNDLTPAAPPALPRLANPRVFPRPVPLARNLL